MRVLVTGATGFIGRRLVKTLVQQGHSVVALTRHPETARKLIPAPIDAYVWDALREPPPEAAFAGVDVVVHLAGEGVADERWTRARKETLRNSRILGTRQLVKALSTLEKPPHTLISSSAVGFYGDRGADHLTEDSESGVGFLAQLCVEWEEEVRQCRVKGLRTAVIRTGAVLGHGGGVLEKLLPLYLSGAGGPVGTGRQYMSWIHIDDLVRIILFAIENRRLSGPLNAVSPDPVINEKFSSVLASTLKVSTTFRAPSLALKMTLGEMSEIVLSSQRVLPEAVLIQGFSFQYPRIEMALSDLCSTQAGTGCALYELEQWTPQPADRIFPFFSEARNLEQILPPSFKMEVLQMSTPQVQEGTLIEYRLKLHGVPLRWKSRIEEWAPNSRFVDVQVKGPCAQWRHTHIFEPFADGTLLTDKILYRLPMGRMGQFMGGSRAKHDLEKVFGFRRDKIYELFCRGK